ncbi:GLPGLI family protein [Flavobacterium sp. GT3P67]|uniref:GLPGLI family protein n=1 Tax=Flavobacterium sp. GT3P67 TaxID=2541722 RepID=UPI00104D59C2|nr:GLPGLI family protein [Flavobacterium sp. GT3P67]TDE52761.1 GLPGLI family protein [Flavobacterium sp. GT3P67]
MRFFLFFIFLFNFSYAQSGKIEYNVLVNLDMSNVPKSKVDFLNQMVSDANNLKFELVYNRYISSFKNIESLENTTVSQIKMLNIARAAFTPDSDVYINYIEEREINKKSDGTLVGNEYGKNTWEISKESKQIAGYLCYKAIQNSPFVDRKGEHKVKEILAWFAPSLPYSYGPKNFYGLPGLILELTENKTTYFVIKIELFDKELEIDFPKGKTVTKEEYDKKVKAQLGM